MVAGLAVDQLAKASGGSTPSSSTNFMNEGGTIESGLDTPTGRRWMEYLFQDLTNESFEREYPWIGFPKSPEGTLDVWDIREQ